MNGAFVVNEETALIETLRRIDQNTMQLAIVVRDGRIVGTVTDGDVRRALLTGVALDASVSLVMNRTPITAPIGTSNPMALSLMRKHGIHQLPIVDADGRVIEVKLIDELALAQQSDHWVVLMAGGLGSRLKPLTDDIPKPLIKVGDKPILETVLGGFAKAGFGKFFISVNYKAEMIRDYFGDGSAWGVEIDYLQENERLGTAGALSLLPERPRRPFFVNAGVYLLDPGVLDHLSGTEAVDMPTLIERTIAAGKPSVVFPLREYWIDVGRLDDLQRASDEFQRFFR